MVMFMCTAVVPKSRAMAGRAVATTVESSICMNRAQPTIRGIIRRSRGEGAGPEGEGSDIGWGWLRPSAVNLGAIGHGDRLRHYYGKQLHLGTDPVPEPVQNGTSRHRNAPARRPRPPLGQGSGSGAAGKLPGGPGAPGSLRLLSEGLIRPHAAPAARFRAGRPDGARGRQHAR